VFAGESLDGEVDEGKAKERECLMKDGEAGGRGGAWGHLSRSFSTGLSVVFSSKSR
jgi:hypothetical protein